MTKKGNKNAYKHGIYAKRIQVIQNIEALETMPADVNTAELAHARVMLADASDRRNNAANEDDRLKWDYACRHWSEVIDSYTYHNAHRGEVEIQIFESLLDAIRAANDKQNVKR